MITVAAFILTLAVLIVVHEYGHYRVAVACGVKVLRFSVGFGRVIWRRQATPQSTEFVVSALPLGGYVRMLDEREGPVAPDELHRAFNRKSLWQRTAVVAAGPIANLLLAVLLYACAHWIGMDEAKALLGPPAAGSLAERGGLRTGDWAQAWSEDGSHWEDLRSMNDLRWQVTQAVLHERPLHLMVTDAQGRGQRRVVLDLDTLDASEVDARTMKRIGIGSAFSEPVLREAKPGGPAALAGLRAGDRVLSIDGRTIDDASRILEIVRASGADGTARAMAWRIERAGQAMEIAVTPKIVTDGNQTVGRIEVYPGQPPQMVMVRYGAFEGLSRAVTRTWEMSALTLQMLGKMLDRRSLAEEPQRSADDRRLCRAIGATRPGVLPRLPRRGQREPRRAEPAAAADARWRAPDVLSFRGCDGAAGLRVVARTAAAWRGGHHAHDDVPGSLQRRGPPAGPALTPDACLPPAARSSSPDRSQPRTRRRAPLGRGVGG